MKSMNKKLLGAGVGVLVLIAGAAVASSYVTRDSLEANNPKPQPTVHHKAQNAQQVATTQPVAATPRCDDSNIVGTVVGGAAGGVVGSQVGNGAGKTAATIGGVLGGAYLGNQYIPTRNVTCRQ